MRAPDAGTAPIATNPPGLVPPGDPLIGVTADQTPAPMEMDPPCNIRALTSAARGGDAQAFSRLYDLYSFRLYKYLLVLAHGDEQEAREVLQVAFIKLAKRCDVFDDESRLWAWLCVLARNAFVDHCRARQRRNRFLSLDALPIEPSEPINPEHRLAEILQTALGGLSPEERELLEAAYVDQQPLQNLAVQSGQTYKSVESRLRRLRHKIKDHLLRKLSHENESGL